MPQRLLESGPEMSATGAKKAKALEPGQTVAERYVVKRVLGQGGMGQVLEVEHIALGRPFALKVLRLERLTDELIRRFNREARALGSVTSPRVAQVTDFGIDSQAGPFYVMELLEGETLEDRLERETKVGVVEALTIAAELCDALADVHAAGIVHRDLKPSNVGLPGAGPVRVKLLDFGLAASMDDAFLSRITQSHQILGSLPYMAPEQFNGAEPAVAMDIYALGVLLYECLTGQMPFMALNTAALIHHILSTPVPALPPELAAVPFLDVLLGRLLAKEASDRFPSASAAAEAIRNMLGDQAPPRPITRPAMDHAMPHTMQAPLPRPPPEITESGTRPSAPVQTRAPGHTPAQIAYPAGQLAAPQPSPVPSYGHQAMPQPPVPRAAPIAHSQPGGPAPTAALLQAPPGVSMPGYASGAPSEPSIGLRIAVASGVGIILATVTAIAVAMALTLLDDRTGSDDRPARATSSASSDPRTPAATPPIPQTQVPQAPQAQAPQAQTPQAQAPQAQTPQAQTPQTQVQPDPGADQRDPPPARPSVRRTPRGRRGSETGRYSPEVRRLPPGPSAPAVRTIRPRPPQPRPPPQDPDVIRTF